MVRSYWHHLEQTRYLHGELLRNGHSPVLKLLSKQALEIQILHIARVHGQLVGIEEDRVGQIFILNGVYHPSGAAG